MLTALAENPAVVPPPWHLRSPIGNSSASSKPLDVNLEAELEDSKTHVSSQLLHANVLGVGHSHHR